MDTSVPLHDTINLRGYGRPIRAVVYNLSAHTMFGGDAVILHAPQTTTGNYAYMCVSFVTNSSAINCAKAFGLVDSTVIYPDTTGVVCLDGITASMLVTGACTEGYMMRLTPSPRGAVMQATDGDYAKGQCFCFAGEDKTATTASRIYGYSVPWRV